MSLFPLKYCVLALLIAACSCNKEAVTKSDNPLISDSIALSAQEIEDNLNNRIDYFIQLYGSKEKLEQVSGKTVQQLKEDYREMMENELQE